MKREFVALGSQEEGQLCYPGHRGSTRVVRRQGEGNTEAGLYCGFWGEGVSAGSVLASLNHFSGLQV